MIKLVRFFAGVSICLLSIWAFFYNFYLFPTPTNGLYWWTIPEAITVAVFCLIIFFYGTFLIDLGVKNEEG